MVAKRTKRQLGRLGDNVEAAEDSPPPQVSRRRVPSSSNSIEVPDAVAGQHTTKTPRTPGVGTRRRLFGGDRNER
jgi:hypothetical protein